LVEFVLTVDVTLGSLIVQAVPDTTAGQTTGTTDGAERRADGALTRKFVVVHVRASPLSVRLGPPLEMLQVECHPFFQQSELRTWCDHHGWAFTAYSPLARGEVLYNDVLQAIAASHDVSPATVTLAWHLRHDGLTVIPRTSNFEHLRSNLDALELELTDDELARIDGLDEGRRLVSPDHAPWD
jgi:aryl-alcohol dehydrogenase-like predicted oxidoreductase